MAGLEYNSLDGADAQLVTSWRWFKVCVAFMGGCCFMLVSMSVPSVSSSEFPEKATGAIDLFGLDKSKTDVTMVSNRLSKLPLRPIAKPGIMELRSDAARFPRSVFLQRSGVLSSALVVHGVQAHEQPPQEQLRDAGVGRRTAMTASAAAALISTPLQARARLEGVSKPELLPKEFTTVIDVAGFLTKGELARIVKKVELLEKDTGFKLRVLTQTYPETPGLAIKDYWGVDGDTVVFVADPTFGNIMNFNVGANVDLAAPRNFWTRLAGTYGTKKYWQTEGQNAAIQKAVNAISTCLREPPGRGQCSNLEPVSAPDT